MLTQDQILPLPSDSGALANRINKATRKNHSKINNLINLKIVFALRNYRIYRQGIQSFYHVFTTFEDQWKQEMAKDTEVGALLREVWTPAMARTDPLTKDLLFYYDNDSKKFSEPIMTEQVEFVKHIRKVTSDKPHLLLAYGHVMYLALFAGGRILRSNFAKTIGLFPQMQGLTTEQITAKGTNLFRFQVDDEDELRQAFKTRYELATRNNLTEQQKREIIDESMEIFERNTACIGEISRKNALKGLPITAIVLVAVTLFLVYLIVRLYY